MWIFFNISGKNTSSNVKWILFLVTTFINWIFLSGLGFCRSGYIPWANNPADTNQFIKVLGSTQGNMPMKRQSFIYWTRCTSLDRYLLSSTASIKAPSQRLVYVNHLRYSWRSCWRTKLDYIHSYTLKCLQTVDWTLRVSGACDKHSFSKEAVVANFAYHIVFFNLF